MSELKPMVIVGGPTMWLDYLNKKTDDGSTPNRLFHYASWYVTSRGYEFAKEVTEEIMTMIQGASKEIHHGIVPKGLEISDPHLAVEFKTRIAEVELGMFIDLMISDSPNLQPGRLTIIPENALLSAKSKFCPIWLIC